MNRVLEKIYDDAAMQFVQEWERKHQNDLIIHRLLVDTKW